MGLLHFLHLSSEQWTHGGCRSAPMFSSQIFKQKKTNQKGDQQKSLNAFFKTVVAPHCQADVSLTTTLAAVGLGKARVAFQVIRLWVMRASQFLKASKRG